MLTGYRKRFVIINMSLIGIVLALAFIGLAAITYRNDYDQLSKTMSMVLEPLASDKGRFFGGEAPPFGEWDEKDEEFDFEEDFEPEDGDTQFDRRNQPRMITDRQFMADRIVTVFYSQTEDSLTVIGDTSALDSDVIERAVKEIVTLEEDYGRLREYSIIYRREGGGDRYRIALADTSYLTSRLVKNSAILAGIFLLAMGFFLIISIFLSRLAAKPMEDAIEMERQFVADISHDLKTPITVILANNSILKSSPDSPVGEQTQWIDSTDAAAKNMMELVTQMLTLSSLESTEKNIVKVPVDLSSAAEKVVLQLESIAYDRGILIDEDIDEGIFTSATTEFADKICSGLIENALKYEPDGGSVQVSLKADRKKAVLTVRNPGSVISAEDLPHIFERFYRGDKSRGTKKGYGLGLPIIKQVTELIGAEITAKSGEAEGTVFTVVFDVCEK